MNERTVTEMADMMNFQKRWEDFLHDYEFEDARRIYTNGSRLIPSFRVKQMMEHYAPVRHGRWVHHIAGGKQISACWCSVCNVEHETEQNYCPNCGAKMDGGVEAR